MRSMRPVPVYVALAMMAGCQSTLSALDLHPPEQVSVNVGPDLAEIQFSAVERATSYRIYYTSDPTLDTATAELRDTTVPQSLPLQSGSTWRIAVSAWSGLEESALSPVVLAVPLAAGPTFPALPDVVIEGSAGERLGVNLAALDYDGDGTDDLAVASSGTDGIVRIHRGRRGGPDSQPLGAFGPVPEGFGGLLGADVDGDGLEELILGEPGYDDPGNGPDNGHVVGFFGNPFFPGEVAFQFSSSPANSLGGSVLAALGDVNADGFADFASAEPGGAHQVRVYFGADDFGLTDVVLPVAHGGDIRLAGGDVNGDGYPDLLVSSPDAPDGYAALHLGLASGLFDETPVWSATLTAGSRFGETVAVVGDMDGDGADEVAVGAPGAGRLLVYSWENSGTIEAFVDSSGGAGFGARVVAAGNPNATRARRSPYDDLFVADKSFAGDAGFVSFYSSEGRTDRGYVEEWSATGAPGEQFGEALATGDFDGDGAPDLAVGAPMADVGPDALAGEVRVYLARRYDGPVVSAGPTLSEQQGFRVYLGGSGFIDPVRGQSHVCTWKWDDATPNTVLDPCDAGALGDVEHVYATPGNYHPVLRVESPLGAGEAATTVYVRDLDD